MFLQKSLARAGFKREAPLLGRQKIEKLVHLLAQTHHAAQQRRLALLGDPHGLLGVASQFLKTVIRYLSPEVIAGHIFDLVRFVKYDRRILRQYAAKIILAQRQIGKEEMMVNDN